MIQLVRAESGSSYQLTRVTINLKDKLTPDFDTSDGILISVRSQLSKRYRFFTPIVNWGEGYYNSRFTTFFIYTSATGSDVSLGIIQMGTEDYPLGFYDVIIYQNSFAANFNPDGLNVIYTGLANVTATTDAQSPIYTEYEKTYLESTTSVYETLN